MWSDQAACKGLANHPDYGPIWWGTAKQPKEQIDLALSVCKRCPVVVECDKYTQPIDMYYIKGGKRYAP